MKKFLAIFVLAMLILYVANKESTTKAMLVKNTEKPTAGTYTFDKAHSFIEFRVKHLGLIDVPGYFRDFEGTIIYDEKDVTRSSVEFYAKAASIDTGIAARDNHLRSADFFDVEKYPQIAFKSTKVEKKGESYFITGDLTIKGTTKQISFPFQITGFIADDPRSAGRMGVIAETTINRRDFGITYGSTLPNGTPAIADEVKVFLQIEAIKPRSS
jgi:polyisoprenoid-binding protein YceI